MTIGKKEVAGLGDGDNQEDPGETARRKSHPILLPRMPSPKHVRVIGKYCPLIAAIAAPMTTLLDIPALTQHWYSRDGINQPDPTACLVLSALGLALNVLANVLLIIRFSSKSPWWTRNSTRLSLVSWLGKTIIALINLILFGILTRNGDGYQYMEGFWCAVISVIGAGIITIALGFHYIFAFGKKGEDTAEVRLEGKKFMLSVTAFFGILAIQSLVFCKIEGWLYSDAIYFSVQTALTIGYGDYHPTTTAGKVLIFPFSVLTISQLGNEIALIIGFISARAEERRGKWRERYEGAMHREANKLRPKASLIEEMALIHQINNQEEMMSQIYDLLWSALALITFWAVGATLFSQIEGWTWGNGVYAVMILSLTIGFGDFTPVHPAGKVVFVIYALTAVPIVTSFVVQTITGLLSTYSERGAIREAFLKEKEAHPEAFRPHADFVLRAHELYGDIRKRLLGDDSASLSRERDEETGHKEEGKEESESADTAVEGEKGDTKHDEGGVEGEGKKSSTGGPDAENEDEEQRDQDGIKPKQREGRSREDNEFALNHARLSSDKEQGTSVGQDKAQSDGVAKTASLHRVEYDMLKQLMDLTVQLEAEARQMMLDSMDKGIARTLLLADRNVQARVVRAIRGDDANMLSIWRGEEAKTAADQKTRTQPQSQGSADQQDMLSRVRRYRNTFAEILVIGSILQKLEGDELNRFERWREVDADERDEERREEGEDIEDVAEERYDGITGMIFKRHARRLRDKNWGRVMTEVERGKGEGKGKEKWKRFSTR